MLARRSPSVRWAAALVCAVALMGPAAAQEAAQNEAARDGVAQDGGPQDGAAQDGTAGAGFAAGTAQEVGRPAVEAILAQALVERGAYAACARIASNSDEAVMDVARSWRLDLTDTSELLRRSGYAPAYVDRLAARSSLEVATPSFARPDQLAAFCASLGNWQERLSLLMNIVPQEKIGRLLRHRTQ